MDIVFGGVRADAPARPAERCAGPFADLVPTFDADMTRDLADLVQSTQWSQ